MLHKCRDRASKPIHFCQESFCFNIFLARKKSISLLKSWNKLRGWSLTAIFQMGKWPQTASRDLAEKGQEDAGWKKESLSRTSGSLLHCCFGMKAVGVKGAVSALKKPKNRNKQWFALSAHALADFVASTAAGSAVPASVSPPHPSRAVCIFKL